MKTFLLATFFVTQLLGNCVAASAVLPEIPAHKLDVPQVLAIFQQQMHESTNYAVVGIDWCKASDFQPRIQESAHYYPGNDHPNDYSWFVTYLYEWTDKELKQGGIKHRFNSVGVIRIKDDGKVGFFIGAQ